MEGLCKQLYESRDANQRSEAEKALVNFQNSTDRSPAILVVVKTYLDLVRYLLTSSSWFEETMSPKGLREYSPLVRFGLVRLGNNNKVNSQVLP